MSRSSSIVVPTDAEHHTEPSLDKSRGISPDEAQEKSSGAVDSAPNNLAPDTADNQIATNSSTIQPLKTQLSSTSPSAHSSTQLAIVQKTPAFQLMKNYRALATSFKHLQRFSRNPDGKYPAQTICVLCAAVKPSSVLFPCQHMCVCNNCILSNDMSPDYSMTFERCICPVCRTDIRLILPHTGDEEEKYWDWVLATKSSLPSEFKKSFKNAGKKLREDSVAESRVSTVGSLTSHPTSDAPTPTRPYRRSFSTPTMAKRGSAYKLDSSKRQESCLIL